MIGVASKYKWTNGPFEMYKICKSLTITLKTSDMGFELPKRQNQPHSSIYLNCINIFEIKKYFFKIEDVELIWTKHTVLGTISM